MQRNSTRALSLPGKFGRQMGITHDPVKTHNGNLMQDEILGLFNKYGNDSISSLAQGNEDDSKKGSSIHKYFEVPKHSCFSSNVILNQTSTDMHTDQQDSDESGDNGRVGDNDLKR
ncbi:hypothetical protein R1flu_025594 [Riccia fluitans]|uniref:Uncharacterized protein n=1 Tax=Riccia fluitans TaxID=41844 RepID=A0ABD1XYE1_9MARC